MAVAMLALFVALTGSAYAGVKLSKNSVTTKTIKNGAVTGAKVKKDTLTGKQIKESKLGTVPSAAALVGFDPNSKVDKSHFVSFNVSSNRGDAPKTLASFGPWTLVGRCDVNGANTNAAIDVVTSKAGTYTPDGSDTPIGTYSNWVSYSDFPANTKSYSTSSYYFLDPETGISALDGDGEPVGIWAGFPGADCRFVGDFPVTRP